MQWQLVKLWIGFSSINLGECFIQVSCLLWCWSLCPASYLNRDRRQFIHTCCRMFCGWCMHGEAYGETCFSYYCRYQRCVKYNHGWMISLLPFGSWEVSADDGKLPALPVLQSFWIFSPFGVEFTRNAVLWFQLLSEKSDNNLCSVPGWGWALGKTS